MNFLLFDVNLWGCYEKNLFYLLSLPFLAALLFASPSFLLFVDVEGDAGLFKFCSTLDWTSFRETRILCSVLPASILLMTASQRPFLRAGRWARLASLSASSFWPDAIMALIFEITLRFGILYFLRATTSDLRDGACAMSGLLLFVETLATLCSLMLEEWCSSAKSLSDFDGETYEKGHKTINVNVSIVNPRPDRCYAQCIN